MTTINHSLRRSAVANFRRMAAGLALMSLSNPNIMADDQPMNLVTRDGVRFAILGEKPAAPAPTLFVFAVDRGTSLGNPDYDQIGRILLPRKFLCVSLDLPAHGDDMRPGEPKGLEGWRARLDHGEDFVAPFARQATAVLEHLIREGYADPDRIAAAGTSRGGFMALQFAAREPRIAAVVAFCPVTDLPVLKEFKGMEADALTQSLAATTLADALRDRPLWIVIGNDDQRVGTDHCIAFARAAAKPAQDEGRVAQVELRVLPSQGHGRPAHSHEDAAAWLIEQFGRDETEERK